MKPLQILPIITQPNKKEEEEDKTNKRMMRLFNQKQNKDKESNELHEFI